MGHSPSILVVDDSADLLALMKLLIETHCRGDAIVAASFADVETRENAALASDMAILDINLGPDKPSGVDVYRWLREKGYDKPVFFLTGHASTYPLVDEAERLGDARVLSKPIEPYELIRILKQRFVPPAGRT
ncbi:MAG: response regulator [Oligoflexales bacterium]